MHPRKTSQPIATGLALLSATLSLSATTATSEVQLLPVGKFAARDGRPGPGKTWQIDDATGTRLAADLTALAARTAFVIDYDHQTLNAAVNGQPAPAAGWATQFEWRSARGLFATQVQWTEAAQARIEASEYRYVSPVIQFSPTDGRVTGVLMAAITNFPALLGMDPLGQALAAQLSAFTESQPKEPSVDLLAQLMARLGLPAGTTEAEALSAVDRLKTEAHAGATELAALSASHATTATTIAALQGELATLTAAAAEREVAEVLTAALSAGKLLPVQRQWATDYGRKDLAGLKAYVAAAPVVAALQSQTGGRAPAGDDMPTDDAQALAAKARAYQTEQLAAGVTVSSAQAVAHLVGLRG